MNCLHYTNQKLFFFSYNIKTRYYLALNATQVTKLATFSPGNSCIYLESLSGVTFGTQYSVYIKCDVNHVNLKQWLTNILN